MAVDFTERWDSREVTYGTSGAGEIVRLNARGSTDQVEIFQAVIAIADGQPGGPTWDGFIRQDIRISVWGISGRAQVEVEYGAFGLGRGNIPVGQTPPSIALPPGGGPTTDPGAVLEAGYSFNFSTGTEKVTQSRRVVTSGGIGGAAVPDVKKMIGKTDEGLEGTDKLAPAFEWSRQVQFPSITMSYIDTLAEICGRKKNQEIFYGFDAGEVMLLGVSGQSAEGFKYNLNFRFGVRKNIFQEYIVGDEDAPDEPNDLVVDFAKGWNYIEVKYAPKLVDGKKMQSPVAFYVHELYGDGDYSELRIGE